MNMRRELIALRHSTTWFCTDLYGLLSRQGMLTSGVAVSSPAHLGVCVCTSTFSLTMF